MEIGAIKKLNLPEDSEAVLAAIAQDAFKAVNENLEDLKKGLITKDELLTIVKEQLAEKGIEENSFSDIMKSLKKQGEVLQSLKESGASKNEDEFGTELKSAFDKMRENKGRGTEIALKAAGAVTTANVPPIAMRFYVEPGINRIESKEPVIYDLFYSGNTDKSVIHWVNYKPKEGGAAFITEGALKPLKDWEYEPETTTYKKIAVRSKHSEEIFDDFDNFMSEVLSVLTDDLVDERDSQLLLGDGTGANPKGIVIDASAYVATGGINGNVIMPNIADVIVAAALQIKKLSRSRANVAVLNSYDAAMLRLTKNNFGNYLTPELQALLSNISIVESEDIPVGKILVGDSRKHKVKNKKGILIKTVYENDDMTKNLVGFVVEQFLYSYRSSIYNSAFVYDDIATIKAALAVAETGTSGE